MTTTFKDLQHSARFRVSNLDEIIRNRGDRGVSLKTYTNRFDDPTFTLIKRDEFGGHILDVYLYRNDSVYYRIEPDNVVETV